ncbi:hypothetical protein SK128_019663, partial [Halocaridina rubra]
NARGWNCKAHEQCKECYLAQRWRRRGARHITAGSKAVAIEGSPLSQISSITPICQSQGQRWTPPMADPQAVVPQQFIFTSAHGVSRDDLCPVSLNLQAANKSQIKIDGTFFGILEGCDTHGNIKSCRAMIYVSSDVHCLYLSQESCHLISQPSVALINNPVPLFHKSQPVLSEQ